jgi:hypothetical protein
MAASSLGCLYLAVAATRAARSQLKVCFAALCGCVIQVVPSLTLFVGMKLRLLR